MKRKIIFTLVAAACICFTSCDDGTKQEEAGNDSITLSETEYDANPAGGRLYITVTSSGPWRLFGGCEWVTPSSIGGNSGEVIAFDIEPNDSGAPISVVYRFFTGEALATLTITSDIAYFIDMVSPEDVKLVRIASTFNVKFKTNIPMEDIQYAFSDNADSWIKFERKGFDIDGETTVFTFSFDANEGSEPRTTQLTLSGKNAQKTIDITQSAVRTTIDRDAWTVSDHTGLAPIGENLGHAGQLNGGDPMSVIDDPDNNTAIALIAAGKTVDGVKGPTGGVKPYFTIDLGKEQTFDMVSVTHNRLYCIGANDTIWASYNIDGIYVYGSNDGENFDHIGDFDVDDAGYGYTPISRLPQQFELDKEYTYRYVKVEISHYTGGGYKFFYCVGDFQLGI